MKIYRLSALVLLIAIVFYVVSGYGITKGVIDEQSARWLHLEFLPVVMVLAFIGHVSLAIRITLIRWQQWNKISMAILILVFGALLAGFAYVEYFYSVGGGDQVRQQDRQRINQQEDRYKDLEENEENDDKEDDKTEEEVGLEGAVTESTNSEATATSNEPLKVFTTEELAKYNGLNGMPAYSAIDGVVYDLSAVFKDGMHNGNVAGKDNTDAFYSKHLKEILTKHPVVGKLAN